MEYLYIIIGIILLYYGGEILLNGSLSISYNLKAPKIFVATIIMGFGTSSPELFVTINALFEGADNIAMGNVIGSNIANILLVTGIGIMIAPILTKIKNIKIESFFFILASLILLCYAYIENIARFLGVILFVFIVIYIYLSIISSRKKKHDEFEENEKHPKNTLAIFYCIIGIALLIYGSKILLLGAIEIATHFNITQSVIGLSMVAIGTSLPEIATTVVSAMRKENNMFIGNILGSNVFNVFAVIGIAAIIKPFHINFDEYVFSFLILIPISLVYILICKKGMLKRTVGALFLLIYCIYIGVIF